METTQPLTPRERAELIVRSLAPESPRTFATTEPVAYIASQIEAAVARERQACAAIAEAEAGPGSHDPYCCEPLARSIAEQIRARTP